MKVSIRVVDDCFSRRVRLISRLVKKNVCRMIAPAIKRVGNKRMKKGRDGKWYPILRRG